ncbi:hypothetical protein [Corynebacterium mastitidis]|uniref:hypothetical protein n=1 Tax=Corynebacterium mastitidis TaxID=161890 RepID=UPI00254B56A8|nr:hypothetical protein [Corynebacterium mastitidis]MDK8450531.1 hypothetical protein [Corynebacterium mastitidis]
MIPPKLQQAIEETPQVESDATARADTVISRPGTSRNRTLQIRLSEEEFLRLTQAAGQQPPSSFARSLLLGSLSPNALDATLVSALHAALDQAGYHIAKNDAA